VPSPNSPRPDQKSVRLHPPYRSRLAVANGEGLGGGSCTESNQRDFARQLRRKTPPVRHYRARPQHQPELRLYLSMDLIALAKGLTFKE